MEIIAVVKIPACNIVQYAGFQRYRGTAVTGGQECSLRGLRVSLAGATPAGALSKGDFCSGSSTQSCDFDQSSDRISAALLGLTPRERSFPEDSACA